MNQYTNMRDKSRPGNNTTTIDLVELCAVLWQRAHIIVLCGIAVGLLAFIGTRMFITPQYVSTTRVYIMTKDTTEENKVTTSDLVAGSYLTEDYAEIVKSYTVVEQTIALLDLEDITPENLMSRISVSTSSDSRIMVISVSDSNPKQAQEIANALRECASVQIENILGENSVDLIDSATLPASPSSPNVKENLVRGVLLGMMLAIAVFTVFYMFDTTIKTTEDIENYLGLNTLVRIPEMDKTKKRNIFKKSKR